MENQKYTFTADFEAQLTERGTHLRRIRALRDIGADVKAGDLGGWLESEANLACTGDSWVSDEARVLDNSCVYGNARISNNACISGNAHVFGSACISGNSNVSEDAMVLGHASIMDNALVLGNAIVHGNAKVGGHAQLSGNADVHGNADVSGQACITQCAQVYGDATVSGQVYLSGYEIIEGNSVVASNSDHISITRFDQDINNTITVVRDTLGGLRVVTGLYTGDVDQFLMQSKLADSPGSYQANVLLIEMARLQICARA